MEKITVFELIKKYLKRVEDHEIQFLAKDTRGEQRIISLLKELKQDYKEAEKKGGLSENLNWHKVHQKGRDLWQELMRFAIKDIDPGAKGNTALYEYLDKAIEFEDLLYGLEDYYRDHTLHSLWVYFLGEHIMRDHLPEMYANLDWHLFNSIEKDEEIDSQSLITRSQNKAKSLVEQVDGKKNAVWCMMALCHDLGYSLAKLDKLNDKVYDVLKFMDLSEFRRIGYSLDLEQQFLISEFLELMAMETWLVPTHDQEDVLIKGFRDDNTYWRLCRALERKEHGILSSYLLYKNLGIFADTWVRGPAEEWGFDEEEAVDNIIRGDILFAISQHEFEYSHLSTIGSLADILILADELEEFSRYGRELLSRQYFDTMADSRIAFKKNEDTSEIAIKMQFDVAEHRNLNDFFKRKALTFCKKYSLQNDSNKSISQAKTFAISEMEIAATKGDNKLKIIFRKEENQDEAELPSGMGKYESAKYKLYCHDDKIFVLVDDEEIDLDEWLPSK